MTINTYEPVLYGGNIITHLREMQSLRENCRKYFSYKSKFFRALKDHIGSEDCVFDLRGEVVWHRGTGIDVSFRGATVWALDYQQDPPKEPDVFSIDFEVTVEDEYGQEQRRSFSIGVPVDLEFNFTVEKFNKLIDKKRKEIDYKIVEELERLIEKYPDKAREILGRDGD